MMYKNCFGTMEVDEEVLFGKLKYVKELVSYEGGSQQELREAFEKACEEFLQPLYSVLEGTLTEQYIRRILFCQAKKEK